MTIFTYTSWRTNIMKEKITKDKITEEDKRKLYKDEEIDDEAWADIVNKTK